LTRRRVINGDPERSVRLPRASEDIDDTSGRYSRNRPETSHLHDASIDRPHSAVAKNPRRRNIMLKTILTAVACAALTVTAVAPAYALGTCISCGVRQ
jgi:hypothetical protein